MEPSPEAQKPSLHISLSNFGLCHSYFPKLLQTPLDAPASAHDPNFMMTLARFRTLAAAAAVLTGLATSAVAHPGHGAAGVVHAHEGGQIVLNLLWVGGMVFAVTVGGGLVLAMRGFFKRGEKPVPVRINRD